MPKRRRTPSMEDESVSFSFARSSPGECDGKNGAVSPSRKRSGESQQRQQPSTILQRNKSQTKWLNHGDNSGSNENDHGERIPKRQHDRKGRNPRVETRSKPIAATKGKNGSSRTKNRRPRPKPPPPPPPPKELIQLLRSDTKVLKYFTSLQENLDADVQRWKDRAMEYKERAEQLERKLDAIQFQEKRRRGGRVVEDEHDDDNGDETGGVSPVKMITVQGLDENNQKQRTKGQRNANQEEEEEEGESLSDDSFGVKYKSAKSTKDIDEECKEKGGKHSESTMRETYRQEDGFAVTDAMFDLHESSSELDDDDDDDDARKEKCDGYSALAVSDMLEKELKHQQQEQKSFEKKKMENGIPKNKDARQQQQQHVEKHPILDDDLFNANLSSSSESEEDERSSVKNNMLSSEKTDVMDKDNLRPKNRKEDGTIYTLLQDAYCCLEQLGVSLVSIQEPEEEKEEEETDVPHANAVDINGGIIVEKDHGGSCGNGMDGFTPSHGNATDDIQVDSNTFHLEDDESSDDHVESFIMDEKRRDRRKENNDNDMNDASPSPPPPLPPDLQQKKVIVTRKTDEDVAAELVLGLRTLTRVNTLIPDAKSFQPFMTKDSLPCYHDDLSAVNLVRTLTDEKHTTQIMRDGSDAKVAEEGSTTAEMHHPAAKGLKLVFRALCIMYTYCGPTTDDEWEVMFPNRTCGANETVGEQEQKRKLDDEAIRVGMRSRRYLTEMITASLIGEVVGGIWATLDRSSSLTSTVLHYDAVDDEESDDDSSSSSPSSLLQNKAGTIQSMAPSFGAKSHSRLASLVERCIHAQIVSSFQHFKEDTQEAARLVIGYVLSATPCIAVEDYPKFPPALSLCVLEALLCWNSSLLGTQPVSSKHVTETTFSSEDTWFQKFLSHLRSPSTEDSMDMHSLSASLLARALSMSVHSAAAIWEERLKSKDDRIRDISTVELAAYRRLLSVENTWLGRDSLFERDKVRSMGEAIIRESLDDLLSMSEKETTGNDAPEVSPDFGLLSPLHEEASQTMSQRYTSRQCERKNPVLETALSLELSLVTIGEIELIKIVSSKALLYLESLLSRRDSFTPCHFLTIFTACCKSFREVRRHQWDMVRMKAGTHRPIAAALDAQDPAAPLLEQMMEIIRDKEVSCSIRWEIASTLAQCIAILADGNRALDLSRWLVSQDMDKGFVRDNERAEYNFAESRQDQVHSNGKKAFSLSHRFHLPERRIISRAVANIVDTGQMPTVRVINLKRRPDRLISFEVQARREHLLVIKAVTKLNLPEQCYAPHKISSSLQPPQETDFDYDHAYDGQGSALDFENRMTKELGRDFNMTDFVGTHWCPNDLKAFDKDARDDDALVRMSPSERACALSHIASWKGVVRSLTLAAIDSSRTGYLSGLLVRHPESFIRLFKVSGFARGPPLMHENESMLPSPVCVILEDDAVLVDRFTDRLYSLLEELPRDFHFCSLGYSRPKTAPMAQYSAHLGIPSCLWYLTGYILSLEGAHFLLKSLPVKGPIDSWIGLKMCLNWDNVLGQAIGVGNHSKAQAPTPSRKDLAQILKFRAFAALVPLCSQKVGSSSSTGSTTHLSWRDRDTDIAYSGNL